MSFCAAQCPAALDSWSSLDPDDVLDHLGWYSPPTRSHPKSRDRVERNSFADGKVTVSVGDGNVVTRGVKVQTDGKIVGVARVHSDASEYFDVGLVRLNRDGTVDTSFGTNGRVITDLGQEDDYPHALQIDSGGRLWVAGRASNGSNLDMAIIRYQTNGTLDTSFNGVGAVRVSIGTSIDIARALVIDGTGRPVVAGYRYDGTKHDSAVLRLTTNGEFDTSFNSAGSLVFTVGTRGSSLTSIALLPNGKIALGGGVNINGGNWDILLSRLNTDGTLDTSFLLNGRVTSSFGTAADVVYAIAADSLGRLLYGGATAESTGSVSALAGRIRSNGTFDTAFRLTGYTTSVPGTVGWYRSWTSIWANPDNTVTLAGTEANPATTLVADFMITRLQSNGNGHTTFAGGVVRTESIGAQDIGSALARSAETNGSYIVAGSTQNGTRVEMGFIRYGNTGEVAVAGGLDRAFGTNGTVNPGGSHSYSLSADTLGRYLFGSINGVHARLLPTGSFDTSFGTQGKVSHSSTIIYGIREVPGLNKIQSLSTYHATLTAASALRRVNSNGTHDTTFGTRGFVVLSMAGITTPNSLPTMTLDSVGRTWVAGRSSTQLAALFRLHSNGSFDTSFGTTGGLTMDFGTSRFNRIALDTDGRALVVGYTLDSAGPSASNRFLIARYQTNGTLDTSFATRGTLVFGRTVEDNYLYDLNLQSSGDFFVAGGFEIEDGEVNGVIYRLQSDGTISTSFGVLTNDNSAASPIVQIMPSAFRASYWALTRVGLRRFFTDGGWDTSFASNGLVLSTTLTNVGEAPPFMYEDSQGNVLSLQAGFLSRFLP